MMRPTWLCVLPVVFCCHGCVQDERTTALEKKVNTLEASLKEVKQKLTEVSDEQSLEKLYRDIDGIAYLTPCEAGYSVIKTDIRFLTVALKDVQPYANGTRVTLRFGNLTSATIDGLGATLEWGRIDEKGSPKNDEAHSRKVKFDQSLREGAWTQVLVVLEGVPPQEFGFVRLREMTHTGIHLSSR